MVGRQLGDLVAPALGKALAARGFAAADVVMAWREIVGERLAAASEPSALEWPRGRVHEQRGEGAAYWVTCAGVSCARSSCSILLR